MKLMTNVSAKNDKFQQSQKKKFTTSIFKGDREFTVAIIGCDKEWKEYMVIVVINQYKNFYGGKNFKFTTNKNLCERD